MQKIILILMIVQLCLINTKLIAQSKYFERSTGWSTIQNGQKIFETPTNNCVIVGDVKINDTYWWNSYVLPITEYGEVPSDPYYYESPNNYGTAFFDGLKTEYGFVSSGYMVGPDGTDSRIFILRLNEEGAFLDSTWLENELITESRCIARTPDNGYLLGGYSRDPSGFSPHPYLVRLNANMEVLWDTTYIISNLGWGLGNFNKLIADTTDNTYYALATVSTDPYDLVWLHLDDTGQILDHRVFPGIPYDLINDIPSINMWAGDIIRCNDGDFLIGLTHIQTHDPINCYLLKLSPDGDTIRWEKEIDTSGYIHKIYQLADSSFILGGDVSALQPNNLLLQAAVVHVSKEGEVLWKRLYGGDENDYIYDFIPTSDGGYFFTGRTESNLPNGGANVYLLKTNCMGLLTEPQANFTTQIDTAALTASFYNLSQFVYPDSIDGGHYIWDFGDGATSTDINPTHTYTQGGNYTVSLTAVVCSDTSVFVQEVSTWAVGINQVWVNPKFGHFVPNPTNSNTSLSYNLADKETATIAIFDLNGRKIATNTLQGNGNYVFDTATCETGIYMYTIAINGNIVERNKLIVVK